jgi:hypothetical protein
MENNEEELKLNLPCDCEQKEEIVPEPVVAEEEPIPEPVVEEPVQEPVVFSGEEHIPKPVVEEEVVVELQKDPIKKTVISQQKKHLQPQPQPQQQFSLFNNFFKPVGHHLSRFSFFKGL